MNKILGKKAYGSTPHLQNSRLGPGDHKVNDGMQRIATEKIKDKKYKIIVSEKLDGSCCCIAKECDQLYALGRAGYLAQSSSYKQHQLFADWVRKYNDLLQIDLKNGDRIVGEWLCQAHSTRYNLTHEPFVPFAFFEGDIRKTFNNVVDYVNNLKDKINICHPHVIEWNEPITEIEAMNRLGKYGFHGALDLCEGAVWIIEEKNKYVFAAKHVISGKIDGKYLPELNNCDAIYNWMPNKND